jgi:outer membrane immunogenic protein
MKQKIAIGVLATFLFSGAAIAADIPQPAPVYRAPVVAPVYNWTGFYLGGNAGYGWARTSGDLTLGGGLFGLVTVTSSGNENLSGGIAGGQIGGNLQTGGLVIGVEFDLQWSGQKKDNVFACGAGCAFNEQFKVNSFGTARGRVGAAINDVLPYVTAGVAWTSARYNVTSTLLGTTFNVIDLSNTRLGWTVGGGVEAAIARTNWTGKLEYLYIQTDNFTANAPIPTLFGGGTVIANTKVQDHVLRAGINYRFGGGYGGY